MISTNKKIVSVIGLLSLSLLQGAFAEKKATAAPPVIDDFAYISPLSDAKTSLRQLDLPLDIYTKMYRRDYGDFRVFSADGQVVPHQFSQAVSKDTTDVKHLAFYPFDKEEANDNGKISIEVNQNTGKQQIKINQSLDKVNRASSRIEYQYIIENSTEISNEENSKNSSLCRLKLSWEQSKSSLILPLKLESSLDLQQWRSVGRDLNVSRLSYDQSQLVRDEVEFSCTTAPFLRLTWLNEKVTVDAGIRLTHIEGFYTKKNEEESKWKSFGKPQYDNGNWYFESDVVAPLLKMRFDAPQNGLLFKGDLYSRNNPNMSWRYRSHITQYRLNLGEGDLQSHPFSLNHINDKYWKFVPSTETQFTESQLPEIKAAWEGNKVFFLAQGVAPFQLAFGSPKILPAESRTLKQLMQTILESGAAIDAVTVLDIEDKGKKFEIEQESSSNRKVIFWFILLLGTLLMGFMSFRLLQQMSKSKG